MFVTAMTSEDKEVILKYANGDLTIKNEAVKIYRKWTPIIGARGTPEQNFMAEVDNECPNFGLRAQYRSKVRNLQKL